MELTARDWDGVYAIVRDLAIDVGRNDLGKVVTCFRLHRDKGKFLTLIARLALSIQRTHHDDWPPPGQRADKEGLC